MRGYTTLVSQSVHIVHVDKEDNPVPGGSLLICQNVYQSRYTDTAMIRYQKLWQYVVKQNTEWLCIVRPFTWKGTS